MRNINLGVIVYCLEAYAVMGSFLSLALHFPGKLPASARNLRLL